MIADRAVALVLERFLGDLAADRGDLSLEAPDARLARVFLDDLLHRLVGEADPVRRQAFFLDLLGQRNRAAICAFSSCV